MRILLKAAIIGAMPLLFASKGMAQDFRTVVIADAQSHEPVAHASLYSKDSGRFRSCISNEKGLASVAFQFQRLTVSHLNYEKLTVRHLSDTIFLKPKFLEKAEVVITNKEPEWIRRKLKQVVKQKEEHYFSRESIEHLTYNTQSMGTNNIYRFHLEGWLQMKSTQDKHYSLAVDTATITAPDSTRLTDTANLRRMLYEDFVAELDNGFIRNHRFRDNPDYKGRNDNEVELRFRSKNHTDDHGWLVVDTVRCTVLSAYRYTGTKTNRKERVDALMYAMANVFGYRIDTWTRDYRVNYAERSDGTLYPAEVRYKLYYAGHDGAPDKHQEEFNEQTGGGFPNMEATFLISHSSSLIPPSTFHQLPPSWYIKLNSEADRQREIELSNLPAAFTLFEEETE